MDNQLNILNRASFEEVNLSLSCLVKPGKTEKVDSKLAPGQVFCLQEISWRYGVESAQDNYGWPKCPLKVSIQDIFQDKVETPHKVSPPKLLIDQIEIEATNP